MRTRHRPVNHSADKMSSSSSSSASTERAAKCWAIVACVMCALIACAQAWTSDVVPKVYVNGECLEFGVVNNHLSGCGGVCVSHVIVVIGAVGIENSIIATHREGSELRRDACTPHNTANTHKHDHFMLLFICYPHQKRNCRGSTAT